MKTALFNIAIFSSAALIVLLLLSRLSSLKPAKKMLIASMSGLSILLITTYIITNSNSPYKQYLAFASYSDAQKFPSDPLHKRIEYAGIAQDGWVEDKSFFVITNNTTPKFLVLKGMIPMLQNSNYSSTIHINVDGGEVAQQKIELGNFELKVQLPTNALKGIHKIDVIFADNQQLPANDGRFTAGKIELIGFIP